MRRSRDGFLRDDFLRQLTENPQRRLISVAPGGFRLEGARDGTIHVIRQADGWALSGTETIDGWRMREDQEGYRLERSGGAAAGRSLRTPAADDPDAAVTLLLDDGRLFRMVLRGPRDARFALCGWETAGAYFEARPADDGWTIASTVAGTGIRDAEALLVLFAAEVVRGGESG